MCPYLHAGVEVTDERVRHILSGHSELSDCYETLVAGTIGAPQLIMRSRRSPSALLFSRWYDDFLDGKYVIVVVERDQAGRFWVATAYPSDIEIRGDVIWRAN
jgi:hypothetical protein